MRVVDAPSGARVRYRASPADRIRKDGCRLSKIFVHLGYGLDARGYAERFQQGLEVDESPYGFGLLTELGCEPVFSRDAPEIPPVRLARRALKRLLGFDLMHAWRNRRSWADADAVWTVQESEWLAVAALAWLGFKHPPMVANSVWLFDRWPVMGGWRRALYRALIRRAGQLTVHSEAALAASKRALPEVPVQLLQFGVARQHFEVPGPEGRAASGLVGRPVRIFAPGNDPSRDWSTLLHAVGGDSRFELVLLTRNAATRAAAAAWTNVQVPPWRGLAHLLALYDASDVVVIPMVENNYSGITVGLEATLRGRPVVAARTGGVGSYLGPEGALWYPPGDVPALRDALLACADGACQQVVLRARARYQREDYSTRGMLRRYLALTTAAVLTA